MKTILTTLACASAVLLAAHAASTDKAASSAAKKPTPLVTPPVPRSSFGIPTKAVDGHDPFFPTSDRLFAVKTAPKSPSSPASSAIVFNGISGSKDRPFAMINGHTFAEGEEAPVNTTAGRVRVLLVAIRDDHALIEVGGERRELKFQGR